MIGKMTDIGKQKLCKAHTGEAALPKIAQMVFGNGGLDDTGEPLAVTGQETALRSPLLVKEIGGYSYPDFVSADFWCRLTKPELAREYLSEVGLIDAEGDLVVYRTMRAMGKDEDMEIEFTLTETFAEVEQE